VAGAIPGPALAVAEPTYTRNEPAIAVASPSIVYLETTYTGYLRDLATGTAKNKEPLVVHRRCSGVVVSPNGEVLTTSVCVQPSDEIILINALYALAHDLVAQNQLAADQLDSYVAGLKGRSVFTGARPRTKASVQLFGQLENATAELAAAPAIPATVVAAQAPDRGNAALVKLQRTNLPVVELAKPGDTPQPGDSVVILGYGRADGATDTGRYAVRNRTVTVTGRTGTNRLGVNAEIGPESRGGAVVDRKGRLLALLDTDGTAKGDPIHDLITMFHLAALLGQAGVGNQLTEVDRAYRDALAAYFSGRFAEAVSRFDSVLSRAPERTAARTYRDRARERLRAEGNAVENSATWLEYGISAVVGALIIYLISLTTRLLGRSARPAPAAPAAPSTPVPPAPVNGHQHPDRPYREWDETVVLPAVPPPDETVVLPKVPLDDGSARQGGWQVGPGRR
jgi:S1-C subfamily serine protease